MGAIRKPQSQAAAQRLLELYAELDGRIAGMEEARDAAIAKANAVVDKDMAPLIAERDKIAEKLEPWWDEAADELTKGKRKSIELGGCEIGTRLSRNVRHNVMHMTVRLDDHVLVHFDTASNTHSPQIIALQINKHYVLGTLFRMRKQLLLPGFKLLGALVPGPGAGNRPRIHSAPSPANQPFRR